MLCVDTIFKMPAAVSFLLLQISLFGKNRLCSMGENAFHMLFEVLHILSNSDYMSPPPPPPIWYCCICVAGIYCIQICKLFVLIGLHLALMIFGDFIVTRWGEIMCDIHGHRSVCPCRYIYLTCVYMLLHGQANCDLNVSCPTLLFMCDL